MSSLEDLISQSRRHISSSVKKHAESLLDHSPRFKYFTLHGRPHIDNLFSLSSIFLTSGINLSEEEAFYLAISICIHDLGMVVPLADREISEIFEGSPQPPDLSMIEWHIRETHQDRINEYISGHFDFLTSLGITPSQCGILKEIVRNHRKTPLSGQAGLPRRIGSLLRLIDELDIGPGRAPSDVLINNYKDMDSTSCWHWLKHNLVDSWSKGHNFDLISNSQGRNLAFEIIVRPPRASSIPYWQKQIIRPINKVLFDEGVHEIIMADWGINISVKNSFYKSKVNELNEDWERIEQKAFLKGNKILLLADDEVRKMEDLMLPLQSDYYVIYSPNAKDVLMKLGVFNVDLAIIDLQMGSGGIWTSEETNDYKATGMRLCKEIGEKYPDVKLIILTGTHYDIGDCVGLPVELVVRKPILPSALGEIIRRVLS